MNSTLSKATMKVENVSVDMSILSNNEDIPSSVAWSNDRPEVVTLSMDPSPSGAVSSPTTQDSLTEDIFMDVLLFLVLVLAIFFFNLYAAKPEDRLFYFGPAGNGTGTGGLFTGMNGPIFFLPY